MNFEGFTTITFPRDEEIVYVLCFRARGSLEERPFYIGESGRGTRRLNDYITAQFAAPTDFKVGVVVQVLQEAGAEVTVKFKLSTDRKTEEARLIKEASRRVGKAKRAHAVSHAGSPKLPAAADSPAAQSLGKTPRATWRWKDE